MGDLLVLPSPRLRTRAQAGRADAEILFFTGVRYYRMDDLAEPKAAAVPKRRRSTRARRKLVQPLELHA